MVFTRTYTYSFEEFKNKDLIKELNRVENLLNHIKKHKRLYSKLVMITAMMLMSGYINPALAYAADVDYAIKRIDTLGNQLLKLARTIGSWTVLLVTTKDCIAQALNGDRKGVGGSVTKGIMIMAVIYFLPELFDMMESIVETDAISK